MGSSFAYFSFKKSNAHLPASFPINITNKKEAFAVKIKEGFVLRQVMGNYVAVAVGEASKSFRGMIKLNATAAKIWALVVDGLDESEIVEKMAEEYDVARDILAKDVSATLSLLRDRGILEV